MPQAKAQDIPPGSALTTLEAVRLNLLLNGINLHHQFEHYDKAGLSVEVLAVKLAVDLCVWGNENKVGNRVSHRTNHLLGGSHVDGLPARRRNPRRGTRLHNVPSSGRRNGIIPW